MKTRILVLVSRHCTYKWGSEFEYSTEKNGKGTQEREEQDLGYL